MDIGLSVATSGMLAAEQGVSIYANDLANANTPAFQATAPIFAGLAAQIQANPSLAAGVAGAGAQQTIGQGVYVAGQAPMGQQTVIQTGLPTDVAIQGGYFAIQTPAGIAYTQDGEFTVDAAGNLVTLEGNPVLSSQGKPITVPAASAQSVRIDAQGNVYAGTSAVAQLGIATCRQHQFNRGKVDRLAENISP